MSHGIYAALAAGVRSFESLDLVANNLANADTPGYRAQRAVFKVVAPAEAAGATGAPARIAERYLMLDEVSPDMRSGGLVRTEDPSNLALEGEGFFVIGSAEAPRYTRDGTLRVAADGQLVHQSGAPMLGEGGQPLQLQPGPFEVRPDGTVLQAGEEMGRIQVMRFDDPRALSREGDNLFSAAGAQAVRAEDTVVTQGALEQSNVDPLRELVELIRLNRFHQAYKKTLESLDEANRQLNTQVGRLNGN